MEPTVQEFLDNLEELHKNIRTALETIDPGGLDWSPANDTNSISVLVVHLTGAERYWLGDVVAGDPSGRDRESEFKTLGWTRENLLERLDRSGQYTRQALEKLAGEDIHSTRVVPRSGRVVSVGYVLGYVLKHTALHVGHIQMTQQLWTLR